jgi:hypothetical protein
MSDFPTQQEIDAILQENGLDTGFDLDGVDDTKIGSDILVDQSGKYHMEVESVAVRAKTVSDKGDAIAPFLNLKCRVMHSTKGQSQEGCVYWHRLIIGGKGGNAPEEWMRNATVNFLYGIGLLKKQGEKFIDPETGSQRINISSLPERLTGWNFIADLKPQRNRENELTGQMELPFGKGAFAIDSDKVASVMKNENAAKLFLGNRGKQEKKAAKATAETATTTATTKAKSAKPAPAPQPSADDMDDL